MRKTALITGASGGIGQACARMLGTTMDLILTDISEEALTTLEENLRTEGYTVKLAIAGDLRNAGFLKYLTDASIKYGGFSALIHTAGLSPAQADWRSIIEVNSIATVLLLAAVEPHVSPGAVGILIASMAGHMAPLIPEADRLLEQATEPDLLDRLAIIIEKLVDPNNPSSSAMLAYGLSKKAVIALAERKALAWSQRGGRIVSLSPGIIWTPMGQLEAAQNSAAAEVVKATPAGRWGTAMDIAAAVRFLVDEQASFITGCDLRVDGGATSALRSRARLQDGVPRPC